VTEEYTEFTQHKFGAGTLRELATKLYRTPIAAYREAVSNALDAMVPFEKEQEPRVEIYTNVMPDGDIIIEDWGTGIENYEAFVTISQGEKIVRDQVSSDQRLNEKIIGQKGMGKLSFLALSSENKVEFHSHSEEVGLKVLMTMEGFKQKYINNKAALEHHGLKIVIKRAKRPTVTDTRLIEYLSKVFAIRIARGLKLFVNNIQVHKPDEFDSRQHELFRLRDGTPIFGNLKNVEKPRLNNIDIFVKNVFVMEKNYDYKVEGWVNCNLLGLETSRDGILEDNEVYLDFMTKLMEYINKFDPKSQIKEIASQSKQQIGKTFVDIMKTINQLYPELRKPIITGLLSKQQGGMGSRTDSGDVEGNCTLRKGRLDPDGIICTAKPIGPSTGHKPGPNESKCKVKVDTDKKEILAPSYLSRIGNNLLPEPKIISLEAGERPIVYFHAPDRLVINISRPSSAILLKRSPKDTEQMKSRLLPLLVRAAFGAYPGSTEMNGEELFRMESSVLDSVWSKSK
jgi:hypothetical protein